MIATAGEIRVVELKPGVPNLVYIVVGIFFLLLLVDLIGWIDLGWHPVIIERRGR